MKKHISALAVGIVLGVVVGLVIGRALFAKPSNPRLHEHCIAVHAALLIDVDDFQSGIAKRQEDAATRFGEFVTYHSEPEIALCAKTPVDLSARDRCVIGRDYSCLAKLARQSVISVDIK